MHRVARAVGVTWAIAYADLGPFNLIVALAITITKAIVIALFLWT
jgi:hypothetical protein